MLTIFEFENQTIRIIWEKGIPWWVAQDIAKILDYNHCPHMLELIDDEDKQVINPQKLDCPKTRQTFSENTFRVSIINESGLYTCIFNSTKPEAKKFKKWVTTEVLPTIRETGGYSLKTIDEEDEDLILLEGIVNQLKKQRYDIKKIQLEQKQTSEAIAEIQEARSVAVQQLKEIPPASIKAKPVTTRFHLNNLVRNYAISTNTPFSTVWRNIYTSFRNRYHIDLPTRVKNMKGSISGVELAEQLGMIEQLYATAQELLVLPV